MKYTLTHEELIEALYDLRLNLHGAMIGGTCCSWAERDEMALSHAEDHDRCIRNKRALTEIIARFETIPGMGRFATKFTNK